MELRLKTKVVVVTGAEQGIGKQTALLFAQEGADLALLGLMSDGLELVRKEIETLSRKCLVYQVNVANEGQINEAIETSLKSLGGIDVLINNASVLGSTAPWPS